MIRALSTQAGNEHPNQTKTQTIIKGAALDWQGFNHPTIPLLSWFRISFTRIKTMFPRRKVHRCRFTETAIKINSACVCTHTCTCTCTCTCACACACTWIYPLRCAQNGNLKNYTNLEELDRNSAHTHLSVFLDRFWKPQKQHEFKWIKRKLGTSY